MLLIHKGTTKYISIKADQWSNSLSLNLAVAIQVSIDNSFKAWVSQLLPISLQKNLKLFSMIYVTLND